MRESSLPLASYSTSRSGKSFLSRSSLASPALPLPLFRLPMSKNAMPCAMQTSERLPLSCTVHRSQSTPAMVSCWPLLSICAVSGLVLACGAPGLPKSIGVYVFVSSSIIDTVLVFGS